MNTNALKTSGKRRSQLFRSRKIRYFAAGVLFAVVGLSAAAVFIWNFRFQDAARFLIDPDPPQKADVIFLLGGDCYLRAPLAAKLFREGYAPKVLIAREPTYYYSNRSVSFTDTTIALLAGSGVPKDKIIDFGPGRGVRSTGDEARALRLYVDNYPAKKILVVTSMLHSRRARMALSRALSGTGIDLRIVCVGNPVYDKSQEQAAKLEWLKSAYYFFTFFG